jgi:hypothetical protein
MENLYLLPGEEAELIVIGGFDAYIRSKHAEITFLNTQARLISGRLTNEQLYSISPPDFLAACREIFYRDFAHIGIQSNLPKTLDYLSNILPLPADQRLTENHNTRRGDSDCCSILPQRDIDYLVLANSYDFGLIDLLFGQEVGTLRSSCEGSLKKQEFFHSAVCSSALNLASHIRAIKDQHS